MNFISFLRTNFLMLMEGWVIENWWPIYPPPPRHHCATASDRLQATDPTEFPRAAPFPSTPHRHPTSGPAVPWDNLESGELDVPPTRSVYGAPAGGRSAHPDDQLRAGRTGATATRPGRPRRAPVPCLPAHFPRPSARYAVTHQPSESSDPRCPPQPPLHYLWFAFVCFLIRSPPPPNPHRTTRPPF